MSLLDISFRGAPFARHSHAGFAIGAIEAGVGGYRARGARQLFPSGTLSLLIPEESHNGFALEAGVSYKMLYIDEAALTRLLDHHGRRGFTDDIPTDPDGWLLSRLRLLTHILNRSDGDHALAFDEALTDTLHGVMSRFGRERAHSRGREMRAVRATCRFFDERIDHLRHAQLDTHDAEVTLATLAQRVSLHPHCFLDVFRTHVGVSPLRYWHQRRIEAAL
ncbi:AraC family ligand binding domain-containing protein [Salinisphaera sp. T5B8]|uniref:AraC family ligand binding domain-containing protein n=1 Tax=Salinisphaera sp. T5B8 TaxID=1304154 RepID=UPI003341601E